MKIKKLQIMNFQGINGTFQYEFKDVINALCLKNGSGKTSFINALRYAITGIKPSGDVTNRGADSMAVGMTFHDGTGIIRQDYTDKSARYFMNGKPVTKAVLDEMIQDRAGVLQSTMKITTSSDVLAGLKPQEFGSLLLSYIPETLTKEKLKTLINEELSDAEAKEIDAFFPDDDFSMEMIDQFYSEMTSKRKVIKKSINEAEGFLNRFGEIPENLESEEELQKMLADLQDRQKGSMLYKEQMELYKQKVKERTEVLKKKEAAEKEIEKIEKEIKGMPEINVSEEYKQKLYKELDEKQKILDEAKSVYSALKTTVNNLRKAIENLDKPVCPLSDKLKCTTDKTPLKEEWEKALKEGEEGLQLQYKIAEKAYNEKIEHQNALKKYNEDVILYNKRKYLFDRLDSLIREINIAIPDEPVEPKKYEGQDYSKEINAIFDKITKAKNLVKINETKEELANKQNVLKGISHLIEIFAPKGIVKDSIAEYYLTVFEAQCNKKAAELKSGMRLKFEASNGVSVLTDVSGNGRYVEFSALSGGEKAYVLFIILDMLNSLTGMRMMILDELSVLDGEAFSTLVRLIDRYKEEYDLIILATAEHDDSIRVVDELGVRRISIETEE